ncbi:hypothetical protein Taro_034362 [Colocasia esculenta]|uniref:Piriformospora indica-insensitive protein 2 n=1 Tax=Colocasia esculenta TaxID=4460 RepID=A0A843W0L6_COLES|nr:hypothetical protein [Colocasia esculenta]
MLLLPFPSLMRNLQQIQAILIFPFLFSSVAVKAQDPTAPMEKKEQEALYFAIQGFVGKSWNGSELYPDPCGWTPIQGVSCDLLDGLWHVTGLSIGPVMDNSLGCTTDADFTPHLFELKHLKSLYIFNCFSDPVNHSINIPSKDWEQLSGSLKTLELRSNQALASEVPAGLAGLSNLQSLVLTENRLTGELPQELGNLIRLRRLVLSGNQLSGQIPASFGHKMTELLILDVSRNALTGPLPSTLGGLRSLLKLDLSNNSLHGKLPEELGQLRNLTLLDLRNNKLTGGLSSGLKGMAKLQELLLSDNPLGGNITDFPWEEMRNLTTLELSNTGLSGSIPESIAGLKGLKFLALDNNQLLGGVPSMFETLPAVGALYLNENNLTGQLGFSGEFYERMGSRFAAWGNPNLCYSAPGVVSTGHGPVGVQQCKGGQGFPAAAGAGLDGDDGGGVSGQSSSPVASFASTAKSINVFLGKQLVTVLFVAVIVR